MTEITSRYIDPLTDYGFKRLFGSEPDKDIMIDFLNALLKNFVILNLFQDLARERYPNG